MGEALDLQEKAGAGGQGRAPSRLSSDEVSRPLTVGGYERPLNFLLGLVRRQRVDFGALSVLTLASQLVDAIEIIGGGIRLEWRVDWLVMERRRRVARCAAATRAPGVSDRAEHPASGTATGRALVRLREGNAVATMFNQVHLIDRSAFALPSQVPGWRDWRLQRTGHLYRSSRTWSDLSHYDLR